MFVAAFKMLVWSHLLVGLGLKLSDSGLACGSSLLPIAGVDLVFMRSVAEVPEFVT